MTLRRGVSMVAALVLAACGRDAPAPPAEPLVVRPPLAGVSASVDIAVEPIRPGEFGGDTAGPLWHRFRHRCSGCHAAPSPSQHPSGEWSSVVERMGEHVDAAGLLPLSKSDAAVIAEMLEERAPEDP